MGGNEIAMAHLNEAYATLSNTYRRSVYDRTLRHARPEPRPKTSQPSTRAYAERTYQRPASFNTQGTQFRQYYQPPTAQQADYKKASSRTPLSWWLPIVWGAGAMVLIVIGLLVFPSFLAQAPGASASSPSSTPTTQSPPSNQPIVDNSPNASPQSTGSSQSPSTPSPNSTFYTAPSGQSYGQSYDSSNSPSTSENVPTQCSVNRDGSNYEKYLKCRAYKDTTGCTATSTGTPACSSTCSSDSFNSSDGYARCY